MERQVGTQGAQPRREEEIDLIALPPVVQVIPASREGTTRCVLHARTLRTRRVRSELCACVCCNFHIQILLLPQVSSLPPSS